MSLAPYPTFLLSAALLSIARFTVQIYGAVK